VTGVASGILETLEKTSFFEKNIDFDEKQIYIYAENFII